MYIKNSSNGILPSPAAGGLGSEGQKIRAASPQTLTISSFSLAANSKKRKSDTDCRFIVRSVYLAHRLWPRDVRTFADDDGESDFSSGFM